MLQLKSCPVQNVSHTPERGFVDGAQLPLQWVGVAYSPLSIKEICFPGKQEGGCSLLWRKNLSLQAMAWGRHSLLTHSNSPSLKGPIELI